MCGPLPLVLSAVSAVTAVAGTGLSAMQAAAQHRYQAKIAERNAALERESAHQADQNTRDAALAHYRQLAQLKGQQRVAAAANGVAIDFGTSLDLQQDTDMLAREDLTRLYKQGEQNRRGFEINASNYTAEGRAQRAAASGALIKGAFDMGSTALSAASQYSAMAPNYGKPGGSNFYNPKTTF